MALNKQFNLADYGTGAYQPSFTSFFPKLARGHAIRKDGKCVTAECQLNVPSSKVRHIGGNQETWREERGIKSPKR